MQVVDFTIHDVIAFHDEIKETCVSIEDWRKCVVRFRDKYGLSDQDAMAVANCTISFPQWTSTAKKNNRDTWKKWQRSEENNSEAYRRISKQA